MRIDEWRTAQLKEIESWSNSIDQIITPEKIIPKSLHDYPRCREISAKLKQVCVNKEKVLAEQILAIEDALMSEIEKEKYVLKINARTGMPEYKKRFPSAVQRDRELRKRLAEHPQYSTIEQERFEWDQMIKDWRSHGDRLRQEMRILEEDYSHNGGQTIHISEEFKLEK